MSKPRPDFPKRPFNCPAEMTLSLMGGKWKAILIYNLRKGPRRFGDLKRHSPGIGAATLAKELRDLEEHGLVARFQLGRDRVDGVEYELTEKGQSLRPILNLLIRWGVANQKDHVVGEFGMAGFRK